MKTNTRFPAGTFLEVDDLEGGRKVVLVGKDGVTFWDSIQTENVTPVVIHPVFKPVELGSAVFFVRQKGLEQAAQKVIEMQRARMTGRADDSLYIMRVLWHLAQKSQGAGWVPDDATAQEAMDKADAQEATALKAHQFAERFCATAPA
jgi:hypothetical protein